MAYGPRSQPGNYRRKVSYSTFALEGYRLEISMCPPHLNIMVVRVLPWLTDEKVHFTMLQCHYPTVPCMKSHSFSKTGWDQSKNYPLPLSGSVSHSLTLTHKRRLRPRITNTNYQLTSRRFPKTVVANQLLTSSCTATTKVKNYSFGKWIPESHQLASLSY